MGVCHIGNFVDTGNEAFAIVASDESYVDKTSLIEYTNNRIGRMRPFICFSRPSRFGESIAAHMLAAYYSKGCDSKEIFSNLIIAGPPCLQR